MTKSDLNQNAMNFLAEDEQSEVVLQGHYKVIIADDDEDVHIVTKHILNYYTFEHMGLEFIDTYSGEETKKVLIENPDAAVIFLDVVMETNHSGLDVVKFIRNELDNHLIRIVLRTGQPGEAPEESIIKEYNINDYRLKTELTAKRLLTTMYATIRNFRDLMKLKKHQNGLKKIIKASATLFENNSLDNFLVTILEELSSFQEAQSDVVYVRRTIQSQNSGFVIISEDSHSKIVAATGKFKLYIGMTVDAIPELANVYKYLNSGIKNDNTPLQIIENGFVISSQDSTSTNNYIYIEGNQDDFDFDLINLFLSNFSVAVDNFVLNNMIKDTQKDIVLALAETVESHFIETGNHVERVSQMMYKFALHTHSSFQEAEILRLASTMHDLGKIAIPDVILRKPQRLTKEEFDIIKTHAAHGFRILNGSDLPILKMAAEIALNHHEKFDGSGYPGGKKDKNIPLNARMMAIVDVFDAMSHKRIYKDAISREKTLEYMLSKKAIHFDPSLFDVFVANLDDILDGID